MASLRLLRGPLLLLLYQAAPLSTQRDSLGRYRLTLGYGGGQWENEEFSCEGNLLSTTPVRFRSGGAQLDAWPATHLRLSAFGGSTSQTIGTTRAADTTFAYSGFVEDYGGGFGGAQIAYEGQHFGIGLGVTKVSGADGFTAPSPYLRIGNIDKGHFQLDALAPSPVFPTAGWGRIGVGFNDGHLRGRGGFLGVAIGPVDYNNKAALLGQLRLPIGQHFTGQIQGMLGPGENQPQWTSGIGLRYDFGRPPR